jgi:hypothetical protein
MNKRQIIAKGFKNGGNIEDSQRNNRVKKWGEWCLEEFRIDYRRFMQ